MESWIECAKTGFLEADVVRWTEGIWERRGPKGKRPVKIGERVVIAEVIDVEDSGWVTLLVRDCIVKWDKTDGKANYSLRVDEELRRKQTTLERGGPERLPWSDETAREALVVEKSAERDTRLRRDLSEED